jgi:hypothetical protein
MHDGMQWPFLFSKNIFEKKKMHKNLLNLLSTIFVSPFIMHFRELSYCTQQKDAALRDTKKNDRLHNLTFGGTSDMTTVDVLSS